MRPFLFLVFACSVCLGQEIRKALPANVAVPSWNAEARFLAGVPLAAEEPLAGLQQTPAYREHSSDFEKMWVRYNQHYFTPIRLWSSVELAPRISTSAPVFYFFGGPDVISSLAFFPNASDFILGGLESVGSLPSPQTLPPESLQSSLANLRKSTEAILSFGFFITKDMKAGLDATEFKGVTPIMLVFLAMSGCEVLDVSYFGVRGDGGSEEYGREPKTVRGVLPGVKITFRKNTGSAPQRIYYVQANVADDSLHAGSGLLRWAGGFGVGNVYLKAASYLLHESYFSKIRGFLLSNAASVLQDDSGIPFSFFQNGEWRCWFFGTYNGTLDLFKKYYQAQLPVAFQTSGMPLPFGTGYKWRLGESNLLLAIRQAPPKAEAVTTPSN